MRPIWSACAVTTTCGPPAGPTSSQTLPSGSALHLSERRQAPAYDFLGRRLEPRRARGQAQRLQQLDIGGHGALLASGDWRSTRTTRRGRERAGVSLAPAGNTYVALPTYCVPRGDAPTIASTKGVVMEESNRPKWMRSTKGAPFTGIGSLEADILAVVWEHDQTTVRASLRDAARAAADRLHHGDDGDEQSRQEAPAHAGQVAASPTSTRRRSPDARWCRRSSRASSTVS